MKLKDLKVGDMIRYQFEGGNKRIGIIIKLNKKVNSIYPVKVTSPITNISQLLMQIEIIEKIEN
ncbi:hypothetical protein LCGC14_2188090 [marine sediment metagenome]|uniref:Uncharacterized protein n=1 Tax=marine sediment metagenome TaxID=412755 RepID=A0A0F9DKA3_9ZZZZ